MEKREILIANNRDQSKYRVLTCAETLGQLQDDIARNEEVYKMVDNTWIKSPNRIDISGLTFTEGITKTQLLSPESALPTNVQFKGQTTNNLVMLLTNTNKQIRSGSGDRKEAYRLVKELGLEETIKYGERENYTRCKTEVLWTYINNANTASIAPCTSETSNEIEETAEVKKEAASYSDLTELLYLGIKYLTKKNSLTSKDVNDLANCLSELAQEIKDAQPKITNADIDDMLASL